MRKSILGAIVIFLLFANSALASENQFYIGGGIGGTSFSGDRALTFDNGNPISTNDISGADVTGKIFGGYRFLEYAAVEIGLHRFGHSSETLEDETFVTDYNSIGSSLSLLGFLPVSKEFEIFGKVGVLLSKINSDNPDRLKAFVRDADSFEDYGFTVLVGGGFNLKLVDNFFLRTEFEWAPNIASNHYDDTDEILEKLRETLNLENIDYALDVDVISTTASIIWHF